MTNIGREDEITEFKESMSQLDKGIKSLTAMLNRRNHGTVYIGVDDDGEVCGVDVGPSTVESIRNKIRSYVQPQIIANIGVHVSDDDREYISINAIGHNIPYSFDGRYYIRNVSSDESAGPEVVVQMVMSRGLDPLKGQPSDKQDLTFDHLFSLMSSRKMHPRDEDGFYRSHGLLNEQGRFNLTAYLVSDQNTLTMQVVRFNGNDRSSISTRSDFGGQSLLGSMDAVLREVSTYQMTRVDLSKGKRVEGNLFDFESFREAWFNACVHNSWRMMIPPSVMVFDDRIEVVSNGPIPFPLSLDMFYSGDSRPVNRSLFELFSMFGFTEQSGHGVPTIVKNYGREAFNITDNGVIVTIPFAFEPDYVKRRRETEIHMSELDINHRKVLLCLESEPEAKLMDVANETGMSLSMVKKIVSSLKSEGLLRNDGTNRNSKWVVMM